MRSPAKVPPAQEDPKQSPVKVMPDKGVLQAAVQGSEALKGERGPQAPRIRTADADTGTSAADWTRFDVGRSLAALRSRTPAVVERCLRKLHLRHRTVLAQIALALVARDTVGGDPHS